MRRAPWAAEGSIPIYVSMRGLEDDAAFMPPIECPDGPVTVTRNERDVPVAVTSECYGATSQETACLRLLERVLQAEAELAAGNYEDGPSFVARMRARS